MLDRSAAPPFVKSTSFDLINPDIRELSNGLKVFFVPGGSQSVLKIEFIFESGRWFEQKTAVAWFTAQLLSKGTKAKSSFDIAQIFDQFGAHLDINAGLDFVSVSVYALHKNLEAVLNLFMEILSTPVFPEKEFSQEKSVYLQNLQVSNEKTSYVASQTFRKNLFGDHHPYGINVDEKHVKKLGTPDFLSYFEGHFHSPKVFVSGKIVPSDLDLMIKSFSQFRDGRQLSTPEHTVTPGPASMTVKKAESVQASIRMGKRSVRRSHDDYVAILFVSHILGGYFGSRLMKNIREEKGLTYGISASLQGMKHDSYLVIGADVNLENTELTFEEVAKELRRLRTELISADELETARNHFIGSLQSEMTTPFAHAEKIKSINLYGLKRDHYQNMISSIDAITPSQIAEISEHYFHEHSIVRVAVG